MPKEKFIVSGKLECLEIVSTRTVGPRGRREKNSMDLIGLGYKVFILKDDFLYT